MTRSGLNSGKLSLARLLEEAEAGQDRVPFRRLVEALEERGRGCGVAEEGMAWTDVSREEAPGFHDSLGGTDLM